MDKKTKRNKLIKEIMALDANKQEWEVTTQRFVGFLDIMGFKDLVARNSHEDIYSIMISIKDKITKWEEVYAKGGQISELIKITIYSDSIMIYSKNNSLDCLSLFVGTINTITNSLFKAGIPHKGACACGVMTLDLDNSIFFGQPLIDAYLLETEIKFYGIVAHSSFENETLLHKSNLADLNVFYYLCPFEKGSAKHMTIYPTFVPYSENFEEEMENLIATLRSKTSGHLRKYIDSTEAYLRSIREDGNVMKQAAENTLRIKKIMESLPIGEVIEVKDSRNKGNR
jgi:hypothetical protein